MKWLILLLWSLTVMYGQLRGKVRHSWRKAFLDHSTLLAPINALMVLNSKVPTTPYVPVSTIPELKTIEDNWQVFRDEALALAQMQQIKADQAHTDIGFNSFFKYGWKRFYLKWYDAQHPSAEALCPRSVALLRSIPSVKAAMFAELPPGGKLNLHRDPYAGSIRYHLGLSTPNDDACYIEVDGERHSWRDGQGVIFDETYLHEAHNQTGTTRIILFCDIERPLRSRIATAINRWFSRHVMSAASSPNDGNDKVGAINRLTHLHFLADQKRKALKAWSPTAYKLIKVLLLAAVIAAFVFA